MEIISRFLQHYQEMTITISTFAKPFRFTQAEVDIFIGRDSYMLDDAGIVSRPCLTYQYGIYASPHYLKKHAMPKTPDALKHHNCLGANIAWEFKDGLHDVKGNFSGDTSAAIQSAACQNLGIARIPTFLTQHLVNEGKLIPLLEGWYAKPEQLKMYYQKLSYQPRKLKLFIDFLLEQLARLS